MEVEYVREDVAALPLVLQTKGAWLKGLPDVAAQLREEELSRPVEHAFLQVLSKWLDTARHPLWRNFHLHLQQNIRLRSPKSD